MRFLHHEHADVTAVLKRRGIDPATVLFVKRRGRLNVEISGRKDPFIFFRKKSTRIDEGHEWEHRTDYFIDTRNEVAVTWRQVMMAFERWLSQT